MIRYIPFLLSSLCFGGSLRAIDNGLVLTTASNLISTPSVSFAPFESWRVSSSADYDAFPKACQVSNSEFYIVYKAGVSHAGAGDAIVLKSSNLVDWAEVATLTPTAGRTRVQEPDIALAYDGRLQVAARQAGGAGYLNCIKYSSDGGTNWTSWITNAIPSNELFYRTEWVGSTNFLIAYSIAQSNVVLYSSTDGTNYSEYATVMEGTTEGECAISFDGDLALGTVRKTSTDAGWAVWSTAPYTNWNSSALSVSVGGQGAIRFNGKEYVFARWFTEHGDTDLSANGVCLVTTNSFSPISFPTPSAISGEYYDGGYGDFLTKDGQLYAVFYAPDDEGTAIYVARLDIWED